tara:strand:+ start:1412 stop:2566 length:1155 start_codon:yes stop_codon:yes gene_type:complete
MITDGIKFQNFRNIKKSINVKNSLKALLKKNNSILQSLKSNYKDNFNHKRINRLKNIKDFRLVGMGGSSLGAKAIYYFLKDKIKKNFLFFDNLDASIKNKNKKKCLNLIISKSGETIETIANANILINKFDKNIVITENNKNYLNRLAYKLRAEVVEHNNFIGGRYSVLSETGMLPAELMGLNSKKFRQLNNLVKNKKYLDALISNVSSILFFKKKKKYNSIILNYDKNSEELFYWYQQLVAESLGKSRKGILPIISNMPKDNHSVMQLYLDGFNNNFFTFFYVNEPNSLKMANNDILDTKKYLKNKKISEIIYAQKKATENVFIKKNIPFRSFEILKRNEKTLGELFCFFILETILLGRVMKINPYDQPAVESIKKETKRILS